jgi:signal transduction histidine kinase
MAVNEEHARLEVEKLVGKLESVNQQLREYAEQVEELSIAEERNRLAREIHDGLGHYLTTIHAQLQAAQAVMVKNPRRALETLARAQTVTAEALVDVRRSVAALRLPPDEGLPFTERLSRLLESSDLPHIQTQVKVLGEERTLSPQTGHTLYRAVQEGIHNVQKYSKAANLVLMVDFTLEEKVRLTIQDDGVGVEKSEGGFGLQGMRERVNLLNGTLKVETAPGKGFKLEIEVPG